MDKNLKRQYREFYENLTRIINLHDPVGLVDDDNQDEYDPEVALILPKLKDCKSEAEVLNVVYTVFFDMFGKDAQIIGPKSRFSKLASDIWLYMNGGNRK